MSISGFSFKWDLLYLFPLVLPSQTSYPAYAARKAGALPFWCITNVSAESMSPCYIRIPGFGPCLSKADCRNTLKRMLMYPSFVVTSCLSTSNPFSMHICSKDLKVSSGMWNCSDQLWLRKGSRESKSEFFTYNILLTVSEYRVRIPSRLPTLFLAKQKGQS